MLAELKHILSLDIQSGQLRIRASIDSVCESSGLPWQALGVHLVRESMSIGTGQPITFSMLFGSSQQAILVSM